MRWHEITVHTTEEAIEMISNFIHELGAGGVAIEESGTLNKQRDTSLGQWYELPLNDIPEGRAVIKGYFPEETAIEPVVRRLRRSIDELAGLGIDTGEPTLTTRIVDEADWADAWKQYFKPLSISERLTIKPTWETYEAKAGELVIELDPGMAFGTGTHATTALCLRTLERVIRGGEDVIDVGTGSGILAIAAAKLGARHVLALDLDPVAVSSARENARLNGLEQRITVRQSDLLQAIRAQRAESASGESRTAGGDTAGESQVGRADRAAGETAGSPADRPARSDVNATEDLGVLLPVQVVVANILAEILLLFVDDVYEALQPGGCYIASGIIQSKEADVIQALQGARFEIESISRDQDWVAIVARKR